MPKKLKFRAWKPFDQIMLKIDSINLDCNIGIVKLAHGIVNTKQSSYTDNTTVLMQYTGLTDSEGKEIYECDLLEFVVDEPLAEEQEKRILIGSVDFDAGCFWINTKERFYNGLTYTDNTPLYQYAYRCKVIGNIFQTPDIYQYPEKYIEQKTKDLK